MRPHPPEGLRIDQYLIAWVDLRRKHETTYPKPTCSIGPRQYVGIMMSSRDGQAAASVIFTQGNSDYGEESFHLREIVGRGYFFSTLRIGAVTTWVVEGGTALSLVHHGLSDAQVDDLMRQMKSFARASAAGTHGVTGRARRVTSQPVSH
jgi:hypothetical protein